MKTFCFKLYHNRNNKRLMHLIDIAGVIYNHCIALHRRYYRLYGKYINKYQLINHLVRLKRTKKFFFFSKLDAQAIQNIAFRIERAYKLFWGEHKRGKKASPPRFKKVKKYKSFTLSHNGWKLDEASSVITIQKKRYRYIKTRNIEGKIKTITVKRDSLGDIYVYLVCDVQFNEIIGRTGKSVGYDFGLKKFLTASDGNDIISPLFFADNANNIRKYSRKLSHKKCGSRRRERARRELARAYKKVADQRRDFHFKTARKICENYAVVCLETLNIKAMMKLWGKKISGLAFYNFMQILKHEAPKFGTRIIEIDRFYPSSQMCSVCGYKNSEIKKLSIRRWKCPECGTEHDRDRNAAKNILQAGVSAYRGDE